MADPTIQTFCCHYGSRTDLAYVIIHRFNTNAYNSICLMCSALSILGAIYQIIPRQQFSCAHHWVSFSAERSTRIITFLAIADLFASLGVFVRSAIWLSYGNVLPANNDSAGVLFCVLTSAWIQYFYTASWIWTLFYAIDMRLVLSEGKDYSKCYHLLAWTVPALLTSIGLSLLYLPDVDCHTTNKMSTVLYRILPNYIATYIPIATVMIANPCLYVFSSNDLEKIIICNSGQFTNKERDLMHSIKYKFAAINLVFYFCWFPNLVNGILIWVTWYQLPVSVIITTWYIMALTNPLQAVFNCIVYRRWTGTEKLVVPWKLDEKDSMGNLGSSGSNQHPIPEEHLPLLQSVRRPTINGYTQYR